ncbi:MAG: SPASM domain-containing protein [Patescibacteria group bacterium]
MIDAKKIYFNYKKSVLKKKIIKILIDLKIKKPTQTKQIFVDNDFPDAFGFALSVVCQAKCLFCPPDRGVSTKNKFMSFELMEKILKETSQNNYAGKFGFEENGEPLLNPNFLKIFELVRKYHPDNKIVLYSNMDAMTNEQSYQILKLGLDEIHFNVDGATAETYTYFKGLNFEKVKKNIFDFIENRNKLNSKCKIFLQMVSAHNYEKSIGKKPKFKDDTYDILKFWQNYLLPSDDMSVSDIHNWSLRDEKNINRKNKICPYFSVLLKHMYINSDGKVYMCWVDQNCQLVIGDLNHQTIREIWHSEKRKKILNLLADKKFKEIGRPCSNCLEIKKY